MTSKSEAPAPAPSQVLVRNSGGAVHGPGVPGRVVARVFPPGESWHPTAYFEAHAEIGNARWVQRLVESGRLAFGMTHEQQAAATPAPPVPPTVAEMKSWIAHETDAAFLESLTKHQSKKVAAAAVARLGALDKAE